MINSNDVISMNLRGQYLNVLPKMCHLKWMFELFGGYDISMKGCQTLQMKIEG